MPPADISRLLSRIANDAAFAALLASDPDAALADYDLTAQEERLVRSGGADALALLTFEARGAQRPASKSPERAPSAPLQPGPDGTPQIAHVAALHSPDAADLSGVLFRLRVSPLALPQPDGTMQVSYTAALDPLAAEHDPAARPDTAVPTAPWGHDTDSPAVRAAAAAVLAADPADRHAAILDLIAAVTA